MTDRGIDAIGIVCRISTDRPEFQLSNLLANRKNFSEADGPFSDLIRL